MTLVGSGGMNQIFSNSESYFRSFCLAFINARGSFLERKKHKLSLDSVKTELGLSKEEAHSLFRKTASAYEDKEKEALYQRWGLLRNSHATRH